MYVKYFQMFLVDIYKMPRSRRINETGKKFFHEGKYWLAVKERAVSIFHASLWVYNINYFK